MDDDLVRNLMGVSGESAEWMKHPYHAFAAQAGYFDKTCRIANQMSTAVKILQSTALLKGRPAVDVVVEGRTYLLTETEESELRDAIQGWMDATTPEERAIYIKKLAVFFFGFRIPIVRDPELQQKLWDLFPYIEGVWVGTNPLQNNLPKRQNSVGTIWLPSSGEAANMVDSIKSHIQFFEPQVVRLLGNYYGVGKLAEVNIRFPHVTKCVASGQFVDRLLLQFDPELVRQCLPNLKEIDVAFLPKEPLSEAQIEEMINKLEIYGKSVNLIIHRYDVDGNEIAYVHEYRLNPQGKLVLTNRRKAIGAEYLY
jgi:hemin uptake protein HemP